MNNFKKQYRDLEMQVMSTVRFAIMRSDRISTHTNDKVIYIDHDGFTEIGIINDKLTFLDNDGYHYDIFTINLEKLIDILNEYLAKESEV